MWTAPLASSASCRKAQSSQTGRKARFFCASAQSPENFIRGSVAGGHRVRLGAPSRKYLFLINGAPRRTLWRSLLQPEKVEMNPERGFDHGVWAVLKHLYPEADIPVVQLSLNLMQPAQWHFDLAKKLTPLREQGVLVVGSGNIVHNLRAMRRDSTAGYDWAIDFRNAVNRALAARDNDTLVHYERPGEAAALSVPSPEHYLPLLYTAALREPQDDIEIFNDELAFGSISMTSVLIG